MPVAVWGTKVKEEKAGVAAIRCPACGEVTVGDEIIVSQASHIYFIRGSYKEKARLVQCRLCTCTLYLPEHVRTVAREDPNRIAPDAALIRETNPDVGQEEMEPLPLPEGVTRPQRAFLEGLDHAMERLGKPDKVGGLTGGLLIIAVAASLALGIVVSTHIGPRNGFEDQPFVTLTCILVPLVASLLWVRRLHRKLVGRAAARQMSQALSRFLGYTGTTYDDLLTAALRLGTQTRRVHRHLDEDRWRYGL